MSEIKIQDTSTAAFLISRGFRLIGCSQIGAKTFFHFTDSLELQNDINALKFGSDIVSCRLFLAARSHLLHLIHDGEYTP